MQDTSSDALSELDPASVGLHSPIRVLLVDSNSVSADSTRAYLTESGAGQFQVEWSKNLAEAMSRLSKFGVDVVLLDLELPELKGYMSLHAITCVVGNVFPIVILTSDDRAISRKLTLGFGASSYLVKHRTSHVAVRQALLDAVSCDRTGFMQESECKESGVLWKPIKPKILIVDDHRENLTVLEGVLSKVGAEIVSAVSGAEALAKLDGDDFAVVLLDVCMPEMDGFEVALRIRASERSRGACIPVILVTGIADDKESLGKGYGSGAVDYVYKPVNPQVLRRKVAVFLDLFKERKAWQAANANHLSRQMDFTVQLAVARKTIVDLTLQVAGLEYEYGVRRNPALDPPGDVWHWKDSEVILPVT